MSFILKSTQQECIDRYLSPFKTCCLINKDLVVNEIFLKSELTLRHLNSIKYKASTLWMCWQSLLNLDENTPKSLQAVLSRIVICVSKRNIFHRCQCLRWISNEKWEKQAQTKCKLRFQCDEWKRLCGSNSNDVDNFRETESNCCLIKKKIFFFLFLKNSFIFLCKNPFY